MSNPIASFVNGVRDLINSSAFQQNQAEVWRIIYTGANNLDERFQIAKEEQAKLAADLKTAKEEQAKLAADLKTAKEKQAKLEDSLEMKQNTVEDLRGVIDMNRDKHQNKTRDLESALKHAWRAQGDLSDTKTQLDKKIAEQAGVISDLSEENKELKDEINALKRELERTMAGGEIMSKKAKH